MSQPTPNNITMIAGVAKNTSDALTLTSLDAVKILVHDVDSDGDGFGAYGLAGALDCDDHDPETHPGAFDACGDGWDADCDGDDLDDCPVDDASDTFDPTVTEPARSGTPGASLDNAPLIVGAADPSEQMCS